MQKVYLKSLLVFIFALFLLLPFNSCIDDPEEPKATIEDVQTNFISAQNNIIQWQTYDFTRFQSIWMQQLAGVRGIPQSADRYAPLASHFNESWSVYYNYCLFPLQQIIYDANELGLNAYAGIASILQSYILLLMTDAWGDVPHSKLANMDGLLPSPIFDSQEEVLAEGIALLDRGIEHLNASSSDPEKIPGSGLDLIYAGDTGKWVRAANMIRLRYLLRLAHYHQDYGELLQAMSSATLFTGNSDNMLFRFEDPTKSVNPFYTYDNVVNNTRVGKFFVDLLKETNDPRLPELVKLNTSNQYVGSAPGQSLFNGSFIGRSLASRTSPFVMISYAELKFIEAEVYLRNQQQQMADEAYNLGVKASLEFHNVNNPDWESVYANREQVNLYQVIHAKYIALFLQPEVWSDYRRTGYPSLIPYQQDKSSVPRRMLYPQDELDNNANNVPQNITIFSRVWWDRE